MSDLVESGSMSLSSQEARFAEEFAAGASGAEAARRAGYSEARAKQTAGELVKRPQVAERIAERQRALATDLGVTHQQLVTEALWYHEAAKRGEAPKSAGIRGLDLAARLVGAFAPRQVEVQSRKLVVVMNVDGGEGAA